MTKQPRNPTRRKALKTLAGSVGSLVSLPLIQPDAKSPEHVVGRGDHTHSRSLSPAPPRSPQARFLNRREKASLDILTDLILPADARSPGARAARVSDFIDRVLSVLPEATQRLWHEGLAALDELSRSRFGKEFADATSDEQIALLQEISRNEHDPQTLLERFFRELKSRTIDGYYTSEIGIHQELAYRGNRWMKEFPGCTHPEHLT